MKLLKKSPDDKISHPWNLNLIHDSFAMGLQASSQTFLQEMQATFMIMSSYEVDQF